MGSSLVKYFFTVGCFCMFIWGAGVTDARAQRAQLHLDVQLSQSLAKSQVLNINSLLSARRKGPVLYNLYLQNESSTQAAENLYLNLKFHSGRRGLIANMYQKQGQPFSLEPGQQIYATNNELNDGLPGVPERIDFEGGLTDAGEKFISRLKGSTRLPSDRYLIQLEVYQGGNSQNGGVQVASVELQLGEDTFEDVQDIYLTSPGNVTGSGVEITNPYPEFRWEGSTGVDYRLIVVEAREQESPESLLQGALSTDAARGRGNRRGSTLLDYEILDVSLKKPNYQYPTSGVRPFEPGKLYYWQVLTEVSTGYGVETRASEIWSFTLAGQGDRQLLQLNGEAGQVLRQLLKGSVFQELLSKGSQLQSVVIDGEVVSGEVALQKLIELQDRAEKGEVSIEIN